MCGIAGIFNSRSSAEQIRQLLGKMNDAQHHRGPDERGAAVFEPLGAGLAATRLSIVDLQHGSQPMACEDETVWAVLNGEIYNHQELQRRLLSKGHRFRGHCDTEVLIHLYEEQGEDFLDSLEGMFALALLDTRRGRLILARDGPGMKPLCVAQTPHGFLFASEAKALFATGLVSPAPDLEALDTFLAAGYVPAPMSLFRGIRKLEAGQCLTVDASGVSTRRFSRFVFKPRPAKREDRDYSLGLEERLIAAVRSHLAADVPVGAFLSGGWDSSLVAAYAAQYAGVRLKTFSVIFPEDPRMDESRYSRAMAKVLGTDHYEVEYRSAHLAETLPALVRCLEEPCTTAPAGVMYALSGMASAHVKSVLSGEGADELFGGYEWFRLDYPYWIRRIAPKWPFRFASTRIHHRRFRKALRILGAHDDLAADAEWRRSLDRFQKRVLLKPSYRAGGPDLAPVRLAADTYASCSDSLQRRLAFDFAARLRDGILYITDRVSMAHSLEVRMPFLDRGVVDFALALPSHWKVSHGREKRVLAEIARRVLPPEIAGRRKHGLGYPPNLWNREPLSSFARQVLLDNAHSGPFDPPELERYLNRALEGPRASAPIAPLVFLQCWWNEFVS